MTLPIVTICQSNQDKSWSICKWKSDNTGRIGSAKYQDRKVAETTAKKFAELNKLVYVDPNSTFLTIYKISRYYVVVAHSVVAMEGLTESFDNFKAAFENALKKGKELNMPVAPYYYVPKPEENWSPTCAA